MRPEGGRGSSGGRTSDDGSEGERGWSSFGMDSKTIASWGSSGFAAGEREGDGTIGPSKRASWSPEGEVSGEIVRGGSGLSGETSMESCVEIGRCRCLFEKSKKELQAVPTHKEGPAATLSSFSPPPMSASAARGQKVTPPISVPLTGRNVDECTIGSDTCDTNAACTDTVGSFTCACNTGYTGTDGTSCTDIDECSTNADTCDGNAACTNTGGSFTCACNTGYSDNSAGTDGTSCTEINECLSSGANADNCHSLAACTNTVGSFTCACNAGYDGNGVVCGIGLPPSDIGRGDLQAQTWTQDSQNTFSNLPTFYKVYTGSTCAGRYTVYVNHAWFANPQLFPTSLFDRSTLGYTFSSGVPAKSSSSVSASSLDVLLQVPCNVTMSGYQWQARADCCPQQHPSTLTVYGATTDTGPDAVSTWTQLHSFTGETSWTLGETKYYSSSSPTAGPFNLFKFQMGRTANPSSDDLVGGHNTVIYASSTTQIPDDDECVLRTHNCDPNAACTNTVGSFTCACIKGFSGTTGTTCRADEASVTAEDQDECSLGTHACPSSSTCVDTPGAYVCVFPSSLTASTLESAVTSETDEGEAANVKTMEALEFYAKEAASDSKQDGTARVNTIAEVVGQIVGTAAASGRKLSTEETKAVTTVLLTAADTLTTLSESTSDDTTSTGRNNDASSSTDASQTAETTAVSAAVTTLATALQSAVSQSAAPSRTRTGKANVNSQLPVLKSLESSLFSASASAGVSPGSSGTNATALNERRGALRNATKEVIRAATASFGPLVLEQAGSGGSSSLSMESFSVSATSIGTPISIADSRRMSAEVGDVSVTIESLPDQMAERIRALDKTCEDFSKAVLGIAAVSWSGNIHSYTGGNREMGSSRSVRLIWCGEDVGAKVFGDARVTVGISGVNPEGTSGGGRRLSDSEGEEGCASFDAENAEWSSLCRPVGGGGCECEGTGGGLMETEYGSFAGTILDIGKSVDLLVLWQFDQAAEGLSADNLALWLVVLLVAPFLIHLL
eukprot:Cvel_29448.t1-p1 / transcript=Cvel_29448.t1 / gene=Cvel_29448 / organism=Chromera_velia_CCMP2878 / gene_product=Fibrillin-1, putative / transcript_product=Fibrillin-1, putative / location=Cvel_scaffold4028:293-9905(-) / protein_length=1016 / sequence_SO=supercontig / SO=protein_coding / is_pseudo=false